MKITLENEIRLKNMLRQKDKEQESLILTEEIESKEKKMLSHISKDYLNIIERCNDLKNVKNKIPLIIDTNDEIILKYREISLQILEIEKEIKDHKNLNSLICKLLDELCLLRSFYELICENLTNLDKLYFYKLAKNAKQIKLLLEHFKDYRSYENLNEIATNYLKKVELETFKFITEYKNQVTQNFSMLGKKICEIVNNMSKGKHRIIFNDLFALRNAFITPKFLDIIYIRRQLDSIDEFIDTFNLERKSLILRIKKDDQFMHCMISEIVNSYFLVIFNKNFFDYYDIILENINDYFMNNVRDIFKYKDILVYIKMLMEILNIDSEKFNETIGRIAIEYFSKSNLNDNLNNRLMFRKEIEKFIDESCTFIAKFNNNEVDEIFINRLDLYLKDYIMSSTAETVLEDEVILKNVHEKISKKFPDINLRSENIINEKIESLKFEIVKQKMTEIDLIFKNSKNFNIELQNYVTSHKQLLNELYGIIKIKFIELINDNKDAPINIKRELAGKTTCWYKYLLSVSKHLSEDFKNVNEEANKF